MVKQRGRILVGTHVVKFSLPRLVSLFSLTSYRSST